MEIAKGSIGPETSYEVTMGDEGIDGSLVFKGADAAFSVNVSLKKNAIIEFVKKLIPGNLEDWFLDSMKSKPEA